MVYIFFLAEKKIQIERTIVLVRLDILFDQKDKIV